MVSYSCLIRGHVSKLHNNVLIYSIYFTSRLCSRIEVNMKEDVIDHDIHYRP